MPNAFLFFLVKTLNLVPTLISVSAALVSAPILSLGSWGNTVLSSFNQYTYLAFLTDVELASIAFVSVCPVPFSFSIIDTTSVESLHKPLLKRLFKISLKESLAGFLRQELCQLNLSFNFWQVSST